MIKGVATQDATSQGALANPMVVLQSWQSQDNILADDYRKYYQNLSFEYIQKKKGKDQNEEMKAIMMNLHNLENYVTLKYNRDYPLDLVISDQCLLKYNRIFFTLTKVKKVMLLLKGCWKDLNNIEFRRVSRPYQKQVREVQLLRSSMHSFMSTFEEYLMLDAIDAGWQNLKKKLSTIQVFEDLISIHNEFLDKILDKSMLGRKETKIAQFIV